MKTQELWRVKLLIKNHPRQGWDLKPGHVAPEFTLLAFPLIRIPWLFQLCITNLFPRYIMSGT